jgi:hypothetical protein
MVQTYTERGATVHQTWCTSAPDMVQQYTLFCPSHYFCNILRAVKFLIANTNTKNVINAVENRKNLRKTSSSLILNHETLR